MILAARGLLRLFRPSLTACALAALTWGAVPGTAGAVDLGHARVVSDPGAPLQVTVPLLNLTPDEAANLQVALASAGNWETAGLKPPVPLSTTSARLEPGPDANSRLVRIISTEPLTSEEVDVLLDMHSNAGQRLMQVTILVPASDLAKSVQGVAASSQGAQAAGSSSGAGQWVVKPGETLWGIAADHAVADATIFQKLAALWEANPQAFIGNNMNRVLAGATLSIPDDATIRAIDPEEARRIYAEQAGAAAGLRGGAPGQSAALPQAGADAGVSSGKSELNTASLSAVDRLRLSSVGALTLGQSAQAAGDARTAEQHAMQDASQRVKELQANVDALKAANNAPGDKAGAGGGEGGAASPGSPSAAGASAPGATTSVPPARGELVSWLIDHLMLAIVVLVVLVAVIAIWALRAGRADDAGLGNYDHDRASRESASEPSLDRAALDDRLSSINLDLDAPRIEGSGPSTATDDASNRV